MKSKLGRNPLSKKRATRVGSLIEEKFSSPEAEAVNPAFSMPVEVPKDFLGRVQVMNIRLNTESVVEWVLTKAQQLVRK